MEYVFDSSLAGNMTAGDWRQRTQADVPSTLADLVETSNLRWRAQAPDFEAVYGRWIRGHSKVHPGFEFNHRADAGATWGCLGFFSSCRLYFFSADQLAWRPAENDFRPK